MASTPSASALSAVLRCRGNIWSRNPSTKRPATSAYSLGLAGGALRDSALGRTGSEQETVWERLSLKERVVPGGRLTVACRTSGRLRAGDKHSGMIDAIKRQSCADTRVFKVVFVRDRSGRIPGLVLSGWSALKTSCLSLTVLMSRIISVRLALICGSGGAQRHLLRREENTTREDLQAHGQTPTSSEDNSGQKIRQDRPD